MTVLFALAGGAAVGSLYYAQPLLDVIGDDLNVSASTAGYLVTATQVGYAVGIVFLVPLGDLIDRRFLVPALMSASAVALALCALSTGLAVLLVAMVLVGLTTVAGQILVPFAGDLAGAADRGRVVGIVASGLICGMLFARTVSGLLAGVAGWRMVFAAAATMTVVLAVVVCWRAPSVPAKAAGGYRALLGSVFSLVRGEPRLRVVMLCGMLGFGTFTMFWTALTLLLSAEPYDFPPAVIGAFGLVGLVGPVAAQGAGRLHDGGRSNAALGACWAVGVVSWLAALLGGHSLVGLVVAMVALDFATQGRNILYQARALVVLPDASSRLNTAYVASNFTGGAIGSVSAAVLWGLGGWAAVVVAGTVATALGFAVWAMDRAQA